MKRYGLYIFDLDGTLYRGQTPIPHAVETVNALREEGACVRYLTNNASFTQAYYHQKLTRMGFELEKSDVYATPMAAAAYLREKSLKTAFVVGEQGLMLSLREAGLDVLNADDQGRPDLGKTFAFIHGGQADAVVAGFCGGFNYPWLNAAMQTIQRGALFIGTNSDRTYPLEGGKIIPGTGSLIASIAACTGQEPYLLGKPNPLLIEMVLKDSGFAPRDTLVVGDRVDTDIEAGRRAGCDTHLVMTGIAEGAPDGQSMSEDLRALLEHCFEQFTSS